MPPRCPKNLELKKKILYSSFISESIKLAATEWFYVSTWDVSQKFLMSFSFYVISQMKPNRNQSRIWADGMSAEKLSSRENIS